MSEKTVPEGQPAPAPRVSAAQPRPRRTQGAIYQLKVTLKGTKPPIWRRIQVPSTIDLRGLHEVFQVAMGWDNYHLYVFEAGGEEFGEPDPNDDFVVRKAGATRLSRIAPEVGAKFVYEYDFGDSWLHQIVVERVTTAEEGARYPVCLAGKRACPPEDCGGVWGYAELLEIIRDPRHPEHEERLEWLGGAFDPEAFDLQAVNEALKRLG